MIYFNLLKLTIHSINYVIKSCTTCDPSHLIKPNELSNLQFRCPTCTFHKENYLQHISNVINHQNPNSNEIPYLKITSQTQAKFSFLGKILKKNLF